MDIKSKQINIVIETTASFGMPFQITDNNDQPVDLTDATIIAELRQTAESMDSIPFSVSHNGSGGWIKLNMPEEQTSQIGYSYGKYDVRVTYSDGTTVHPLYGDVKIRPSVSRPYTGKMVYMLAVNNYNELPVPGKVDRVYYVIERNELYRWNGENFVSACDGNAIVDISEISVEELEHTHRILLSNGNYYDFVVTDGESPVLEWGNITGDLADQEDLLIALSGKADVDHNHDDRYYTEAEVDEALALKADEADVVSALAEKADADDVYTKAETDALLDEKANTADLGTLAGKNTVDWDTEVADKPTLGALSGLNSIDYTSAYLTNKPYLGSMASKNDAPSDNTYRLRKDGEWVDATMQFYTETEVDNKLDNKANVIDLGTMAYEDDAPEDDHGYIRKNGTWEQASTGQEIIWGDISGDITDQIDLVETLQDKADIILSSASGSIASFPDGSSTPVTALNVGIEPVQDLHGQSSPYPAGGGKNIFIADSLITATEQNGVTFTPQADGSIKVYGTATASVNIPLMSSKSVASGTYTISGVPSNSAGSNFNVWARNVPAGAEYFRTYNGNKGTGNLTTGTVYVYATVENGVAVDCTIKIQLESGSTASSYAPYSNICPISGHTQAVVTRTGKNLLQNINNTVVTTPSGITFTKNADGSLTLNGTATANIFYNIDYVGNGNSSVFDLTQFRGKEMAIALSESSISGVIINFGYFSNNTTFLALSEDVHTKKTVTVPSDAWRSRTYIKVFSGTTLNNVKVYPQLVLGTEVGDIEPYSGTSVTISLPTSEIAPDGIYYGGTVDVLSGTMTVTKLYKKFTGAETETWTKSSATNVDRYLSVYSTTHALLNTSGTAISNIYKQIGYGYADVNRFYIDNGNNQLRVAVNFASPNTSTVPSFKTFLQSNNLEIVGTLAQPVTIPLTLAQLETLKGQNHIWADTGDVTVTYRADTKMWVTNTVNESANTIKLMLTPNVESAMKASKNYASGSIIIVGNTFLKTTSSVSSGANLTVGSNCSVTTMAEWVASLTA